MQDFVHACNNFEPLKGVELADPENYRKRYRRLIDFIENPQPHQLIITDATVDSADGKIPLRIYRNNAQPDQPCCLFLHGGGWFIGGLDTHHNWAADLARDAGVTVISVDYRLGLENPYPAALQDACAVYHYVRNNASDYGIDALRIALYGDSAGGNLCAAVSHMIRDNEQEMPAGQMLIYPALHYGEPLPSWLDQRDGPILTFEALKWCWLNYLGKSVLDSYAVPLSATHFSGLPPTWIVAAEFDPLLDDARYYYAALEKAGTNTHLLHAEGLVHDSFRIRHVSEQVRAAYQWSVAGIKTICGIEND